MEENNEKFFEELVGAKMNADETYGVELVKASTGAAALKPKIVHMKTEPFETIFPEGEPGGRLMADVYQTATKIVVQAAIAGVQPENIDVNVTADSVSIKGAREREEPVKTEDYLYQECYWGRFSRSIILPQEIDPEGAEVTFKNGILTVDLPKLNK